jgi:hypothetical protein
MDRPKNVRWFERLSYCSLLVTVVLLPFNERAHPLIDRFGPVAYLFWLCFLLLSAALIWGVSHRRLNWLRWVKLVLVLLGFFNIREAASGYVVAPVYWSNWLFSILLNSIACYLIFTGDAVTWFKPKAIEEIHAPVP